jgi:hypothetical protein
MATDSSSQIVSTDPEGIHHHHHHPEDLHRQFNNLISYAAAAQSSAAANTSSWMVIFSYGDFIIVKSKMCQQESRGQSVLQDQGSRFLQQASVHKTRRFIG